MKLPYSKEWKKSEGAAMLKKHRKSRRAAWLWDDEGEQLIWHNGAACLFRAKCKHHKLKLAKPVTPIPGQVRRLLRLGTPNLTSLARVRFLSGTKPVSATCSCTPIELENGETGMLIVGVEPIKAKFFNKSKSKKKSTTKKIKKTDSKKSKSNKERKVHADNASSPSFRKKGRLSKLTDQLVNNPKLFEPLSGDEEIDPTELMHHFEEGREKAAFPLTRALQDQQWKISSDGFVAFKQTIDSSEYSTSETHNSEETPDLDSMINHESGFEDDNVETVAKYNFEELSRILGEKVGAAPGNTKENVPVLTPTPSTPVDNTVNLSGEALVLNRLPMGILIFRDQDILFANRALADLVGATSISQLKNNGLGSIFPRIEDVESSVGPVLSIVNSKGHAVEVDARLQAVNWQGASALMLSAQAMSGVKKPHKQTIEEDAKTFVQKISEARGDGYFELNREGIVQKVSDQGLELLGKTQSETVSQPFSDLVAKSQLSDLQDFLERPAKMAQTHLPFMELDSQAGDLAFELFTQGHAGIVKGYFGAISAQSTQEEINPFTPKRQGEVATLVLARLSRGIRRPLNTIMGFSELISAQSFGEITNKRYVDYAGDIHSAGEDIAQLTDELDEYARLEEQGVTPDSAGFDLAQLLDECVSMVRDQANRAQVFVRSAISEDLPNVLADRKSLRQAMLNLLASAIAQTPNGRKVILSAQVEDDQSVGVHVRDSSTGPSGIDDRFVVFQEKDRNGKPAMIPLKSSMGLALTRSLISVNSCALHVDPSAGTGTLMSLVIPAELLV